MWLSTCASKISTLANAFSGKSKRLFAFLVMLPLFLHAAPSFATDPWAGEILVLEDVDQTRIILYLKEQEINALPEWQPGEGKPPMSMNDALEKLQLWMKKMPQYKDGKIREIEFKPINDHKNAKHWYYLAKVRTPGSGSRLTHYFAILSDGRIIAAIQEPQSIK